MRCNTLMTWLVRFEESISEKWQRRVSWFETFFFCGDVFPALQWFWYWVLRRRLDETSIAVKILFIGPQ